MYAPRVLFPESSNREDLTRTISIFDDDTGQPINLSGITFLQNQNGFTGTNWQVTDGTIVTTSTTSLTVPGYPIGNQLLGVTLAVGLNLNIRAGDPISIADVGGNVTMVGYVLSYTGSTGMLVVQVSMNFELDIRGQEHPGGFGKDYSAWYDWGGGPGANSPLITASLGTGLSIIDVGFIQINIPALTMQRLRLRSYGIFMVMSDSVNTRQVFIGKLPVLEGGIMQPIPNTAPTTVVVPPVPVPPVQPGQPSDNIPAGVP